MSWADVSPGGRRISVIQDETGARLDLRLHDDLLHVLAVRPRSDAAIVAMEQGKPFGAKGLGNKMADAFDAAKLPDRCVAHGPRKAAARTRAEAGCTAHELAGVTGHRSLAEVERYTRAVEQKRLNDAANSRLSSQRRPTQLSETAQTGDISE